jgi:hypothetical protein
MKIAMLLAVVSCCMAVTGRSSAQVSSTELAHRQMRAELKGMTQDQVRQRLVEMRKLTGHLLFEDSKDYVFLRCLAENKDLTRSLLPEIVPLVELRSPLQTTTERGRITDICFAARILISQKQAALPVIDSALRTTDLSPWSRLLLNTARSRIARQPGDPPEIMVDQFYDFGSIDPAVYRELTQGEKNRKRIEEQFAKERMAVGVKVSPEDAKAPVATAVKTTPHQNADDQSSLVWMWVCVVLLLAAAVGGILLFKNRTSL